MNRKNYPKNGIMLNNKDPREQAKIIELFKENNIPVYEDTKGFDPHYPYLYWSAYDMELSQGGHLPTTDRIMVIDSVSEFISLFIPSKKANQ